MRLPSRTAALASIAAAVVLAGCVTEVRPREARTTRSVPSGGTTGVALDQPIASPASAAQTVNSRVLVGVKPLGRVPFDGQVLPTVSPDGRHLLAQTRRPPSWEMLLAVPGSGVPLATELEAYTIVDVPERLSGGSPLPVDALAGRSAYGRSVLVERVAPDGARTIDAVDWAAGGSTPVLGESLSLGDEIVAHASSDGAGRVFAASTQAINESDPTQVIVFWRSGSNRFETRESIPGAVLRFPTLSADGRTLAVFAQSLDGTELVTYRVGAQPWAGEAPLVMTARRRISSSGDPLVAYQAISGQQAPAIVPPVNGRTVEAPGVLFFHPAQQRLAMFDPSTGSLALLAPKSISGAWYARDDGQGGEVWSVFLTTPDGLEHQVLRRDRNGWTAMPASTVIEEVYVVRATTDRERPFVLIGPSRSRPTELDVLLMRVEGDDGG